MATAAIATAGMKFWDACRAKPISRRRAGLWRGRAVADALRSAIRGDLEADSSRGPEQLPA